MEQIKITLTQALSSAGSIVGGSADSPASTPTTIDERLITNEILGVRRGHRKSMGRIVKGRGKASSTAYSTLSSESQSEVVE